MWQNIKNIYHLFVAILANIRFGFPSKGLIVVGVTGTDGKTTTVNLIYQIFKKAGKDVSMICSNGAVINGTTSDIGFHITTPSSWMIQKFIRKISSSKINSKEKRYLILEVTSHALDQHRDWGINFTASVLTNVTHEHLDYHKSYTNYLKIKLKLLLKSQIAVVNIDDQSYKTILKTKSENSNIRWISYGIKNKADINLKAFPFKTKLIGEFNKYNILGAIALSYALGVNKKDMFAAVSNFDAPLGRSDVVYDNNFKVVIDFAHTPNGIEQILQALKSEVNGRIIHVFGSAGERDRDKRPLIGDISSKYADIMILTAEDPRKESVNSIIDEIASGVKTKNKITLKVPDRQKAINKAIKLANKGDLVLITGKGHEKSMNYGNGEVPWDEYKAVEQAVKLIN